MQVAREAGTGHNLVLLSVIADLVGVHAHHRDLDRARKVEIVVAQVVGGCLESILVKSASVPHYLVKYRLSCSHCSLVRDHIEVKVLITLVLNEGSVDYCAWARVQAVLILLRE
jgi:hypothetical protein